MKEGGYIYTPLDFIILILILIVSRLLRLDGSVKITLQDPLVSSP